MSILPSLVMMSDVRSGLRLQDDRTCDVVIPIANSLKLAHVSLSSGSLACVAVGASDSTGSEHAPRNMHGTAISNRIEFLGLSLRGPIIF